MKKSNSEPSFEPLLSGTFRFRCHKEIPCFTRCCADLNLILTPYDILRLKKRLGIPSEVFLDRYTELRVESGYRFPTMRLRMNPDAHKTCPFVSPEGCAVYEDRPAACRIYPLGRASTKRLADRGAMEKFFLVRERHCLGFQEEREWTVGEWMASEGLDEYNTMIDPWLDIITSHDNIGPEKDIPRKIQMFSMASYNLDKFREFLLRSSFLDLFEVDPDLKDALTASDVALMNLSFLWLKLSLYGKQTPRLKYRRPPLS